jgi:hypothetical protein
MAPGSRVKLVPWDDRDFVAAFEAAAARIADRGMSLASPNGALAVQLDLRANGFPDATCYCERTSQEVLSNAATRCVVMRDGTVAVALERSAPA